MALLEHREMVMSTKKISPDTCRNRTKMSVPNGEKGGKRFIIWTKIVYHNICMLNIDKEQEGIANIVDARNKYRMLRSRKQKTAFITRVARVFKYSRKYVIMLLGKRKKERKGRRGAPRKLTEEDVQIIRQLWDLSDYANAEYFRVSVNFAGGAGKRFGEFLRIDS